MKRPIIKIIILSVLFVGFLISFIFIPTNIIYPELSRWQFILVGYLVFSPIIIIYFILIKFQVDNIHIYKGHIWIETDAFEQTGYWFKPKKQGGKPKKQGGRR